MQQRTKNPAELQGAGPRRPAPVHPLVRFPLPEHHRQLPPLGFQAVGGGKIGELPGAAVGVDLRHRVEDALPDRRGDART